MDAEPGPTPKPQNETTPDSNSLSSTTETSSESPACTTSSDSKPVTLSSTSNNTQLGYPYFSKLLQGVMAANSAVSSHPSAKNVRFQGQFGMSHQEALATVTAKAAQSQQLQARSSELLIDLPRNKKPESSVPSSSPILLKKKPSLQTTDLIQKQNGMNSSDHVSENSTLPPHNPLSVQLYKEKVDKHGNTWLSQEQTDDIPKTPNSDGYCWRKYGQKTVKNSGSSRSYYRCTYLNCSAKKKVQHLDGSGRIIAVVYKGDHNHDPPQYLRSSSRKRDASSTSQVNDPGDRAQKLNDPATPTSTKCMKEAEQASVPIMHECQDSSLRSSACISKGDARVEPTEKSDPMHSIESETVTLPSETEHCKVSKSNEIVISDPMKEFGVVPLKKRRIKEGSKACSESVYRTFKEPKVVVHATRDVESSSDGYRWRKYGQKMVKGNPNPRSYYRCSSAGCPVRKHVERATDDSTTVLVTYEGTHDHDKPVFKKCHGSPKSPALVAATTTLVQKPEAKSPPMSQEPSQGSDKATEGGSDKATEGGSDKVLESARTLLSIGIELKSC